MWFFKQATGEEAAAAVFAHREMEYTTGTSANLLCTLTFFANKS